MKKLGICGIGKPKRKLTTKSGLAGAVQNLLGKGHQTTAVNQLWVSDITYIRTSEGWLYLCTVLDAFSRAIVGWSMSERIDAQLVMDAVRVPLRDRKIIDPLIFHSDKGSQYRSNIVRKTLLCHGVLQSMTGVDHCYDNAMAESFFATLKKELVHRMEFKTRQEAKTAIFEFIEVYYNKVRAHSSIGNLSPLRYEEIV
jgi:putative transposase